jgi:hypothetical protein
MKKRDKGPGRKSVTLFHITHVEQITAPLLISEEEAGCKGDRSMIRATTRVTTEE